MLISNKDEYKNIPITSLQLSGRAYNCLRRNGIFTLYLMIENYDKLAGFRNMGQKSLDEIDTCLKYIAENGYPDVKTNEDKESKPSAEIAEVPEIVQSRPITDLYVSNRILTAFDREGIITIGQLLTRSDEELKQIKNLGRLSLEQLFEQLRLLRELGEGYFVDDVPEEDSPIAQIVKYDKREFDIDTIKKLQDDFGLKTIWLSEWYGITRQRVYQKLAKRINHGKWRGKELSQEERLIITEMINKKSFYCEKEKGKYYFLNNMKDDGVFLIVTDEDIKCFFLQDLPLALQALLKSVDLQRLSERELKEKDSLGKQVYILKHPYFMPKDAKYFKSLAEAREMSNDDYAKFMFGIPYCKPNTQITDDRIIAFLRENTIDGITMIPAIPENQWIRSYISRSSYNTDEFISLYGFSSKASDEILDFDYSEDVFTDIEDDMRSYGTGTDYIGTIFSDTPLLGSKILSEKNLEILYRNSREFVRKLLDTSSEKPNLKAEMQITLAVINYAKGWDTGDESSFWKYITAQFGYRDEGGQLRNILCNCVKDALVRNKRWFITNAGGNQYKASTVVHAFTTKRSWLYFCDFLFDFYKTNLNWEYIEGDPMIARMILALRNKLYDSDNVADEDIEISAKRYYFREGIIKLILYRTKYAVQLTSSLLRRINGLINHTAEKVSCYEEQLCDEWMANKLQTISAPKRRIGSEERRSIAIDYTRIKPVYQLQNGNEIQIVFPDVRLAQSDFTALTLAVFHNGKIVEQRTLSFYGNELGKTMIGFSLNLEDYLRRSGSDLFDPQIRITCDSKEIFDSGKMLFRNCLAFQNRTEQDISGCNQGGYSIFLPHHAAVVFSGAEVSEIKETAYLKGYYAELKKDFVINLNGELAAFDNVDDNGDLRILVPGNSVKADYVADGIRYCIINGTEVFHLVATGEEIEKKYRLIINEDPIEFSSLPHEITGDSRVYRIETGNFGAYEVSLRILDLARGRMVLRRDYKIIPGFLYRFNRPFYFMSEVYKEARVRVCSSKVPLKEYLVEPGLDRVIVPFLDGEIDIPIPIVKINDNENIAWDGSNRYWVKDIPQERFLYAKAPAGIKLEVMVNDHVVGTEGKNVFALGNTIFGYSNENENGWLKVFLRISDGKNYTKKYEIARIAIKEQFKEQPVLSVRDKSLSWDGGYGFIGNTKGNFKLTICEGTELEASFDLKLDEVNIADNLELPPGEYQYKISKQSVNLFSMQLLTVATGSFFVGDKNELRFLHHIIQIDTITFEDDERYEAVSIRPCFIDHIEFKGIRYVHSEERECPVYNGIMFFISPSGNRHEYSFDDKTDHKGHQLYQINPVRIIYINESTLSITHETGDPNDPGDGFYYYWFFDRNTMTKVYQITDCEPTRFNQGKYYLADLYLYTRKGV